MANQQMCPQCHNTTYHFDRDRHAIVCDVCGTKINEGENARKQLEYDLHRQKAIAFIRSGYYGMATQHLDKMRDIQPDDPDIYYLHLMGITNCCHDMLEMSDKQTLGVARGYWDKLTMLGGDRTLFVQYMNARKQFGIHKHEISIRNSVIWLSVFLSAIVIFGLLSLTVSYGFILGIIASIVPIFWMALPKKVYKSYKKIRGIEIANDPFFDM